MKSEDDVWGVKIRPAQVTSSNEEIDATDIEYRPDLVLSLLEADQLVNAKQHTKFGRAKLTLSVQFLLWGLRFYVIVMVFLVLLQILQAISG